MAIITEEMRFRKRLCEYAKKHGVTRAARQYKTNRQFVYRQLARYDGTLKSLAFRSRRPNSHSNQHTEEELTLIKQVVSRYGVDGRAEVYVQLRKRKYKRSYGSMCKQILTMLKKPKNKRVRKSYRKHEEVRGTYPGDKVQVDIKYIPQTCISFNSNGKRYYQITAIDEYSRKRVLTVIDEKTVTHTKAFVQTLEKQIGFEIKTIQTDNGREFINHIEDTKPSAFEKELQRLNIKHRRTAPYSPWQNGKVERSHREDNKFYERMEFYSEEDMKKKVKRYNSRYNNVHKKVLKFQTPNQMVERYQA